MKKFIISFFLIISILTTFMGATLPDNWPAGWPEACPDCGNTELRYFPVSTTDENDEPMRVHSLFCELCYRFNSSYAEKCTPVEGSATCSDGPVCAVCGYPIFQLPTDPNNHVWSPTQYEWNEEAKECTAYRECTYGSCDGREEETVTAKFLRNNLPSTCLAQGIDEYEAIFTESWAEPQTRTFDADLDPNNHLWGDAQYEWNEETKECTAYRGCLYGCGAREEETVKGTLVKKTEANCADRAKHEYEATFTSDWAGMAWYEFAVGDVDPENHKNPDEAVIIEEVAPELFETGSTEGKLCLYCYAWVVEPQPTHAYADVNKDWNIDNADAIYLLYHAIFGQEAYPIDYPLDLNEDGEVTNADAITLLYYVIFGGAGDGTLS